MKWDLKTGEICIMVMLVSIFCADDYTHTGFYGYSPSTQQEFQITSDENTQRFPAIYGDFVVWEDFRNGNDDIYGYNLSTQEEFQITSDESDQWRPAIYGDFVVWEDWRNGNFDIYGYNLSTLDKDGDGHSILEDCNDNNEEVVRCMGVLAIVVGSEGKGLKAKVYVNELNKGETDPDGNITIYGLEVDKEYTIRVDVEGYNSEEKTVKIEKGTTQTEFEMEKKTEIVYIIFLICFSISPPV